MLDLKRVPKKQRLFLIAMDPAATHMHVLYPRPYFSDTATPVNRAVESMILISLRSASLRDEESLMRQALVTLLTDINSSARRSFQFLRPGNEDHPATNHLNLPQPLAARTESLDELNLYIQKFMRDA